MLGRGKRNWVWADLVKESVYYSSATDCWAQNMVTVHIQMKKEGQPRDLYPQWMLNSQTQCCPEARSALRLFRREGCPHLHFPPHHVSDLWIHFPKSMFDQLKAYRSLFQPFEIIFSLDLTCFSLSNMCSMEHAFPPTVSGMCNWRTVSAILLS